MRCTASNAVVFPCAVVAFIGTVELTPAAELSLRLSLRMSEGYSDNVRLVATPHQSVTISTLSPSVELTARTETVTTSVKAQANVNRYSGDSDLNATDLVLDASMSKASERNEVLMRAAFVRDSTLASELNQTGVVQANRQRSRASVQPSWTSRLTERASLELGFDFAQVTYADAAGTGLTDYRTETPYGVFSYSLSERSTLLASSGVSRLIRKAPEGTIQNTYAQAVLEHDLSELLKAKVGVGLNRIRLDSNASTNERDSGWLAQASVERRSETGALSLGAAREINPTGSGELTQTDRMFASWFDRLSPRLSYTIGGAVYWNEALTARNTGTADRYIRMSGSIAYLITEDWAVEADIAHARQTPDQGPSAHANSVFLSTRYALPTRSYSF